MNTNEILIALLRAELCGTAIDGRISPELISEKIEELYSFSKHHDVAHIVSAALEKLGVKSDSKPFGAFYNERMVAVFRYRRLVDELSGITELFEKEEIDHIALKGSVLRDYYPEPWMRTSCDIDVLVKKEQLSRAIDLLVEKAGYEISSKTSHDVSLNSPSGVHLELHFTLIEDYVLSHSHGIILSVWDRSYLAEGKNHTWIMTDEMFYFYHIAHMAKHFVSGGCGIKPFLDLWVLENKVSFDFEKRSKLISEGGFSDFERGVRELLDVWFCEKEHNDTSRLLEKFVLSGGAYGTVENGASVGVVRRQGRMRYALGRIFPSYRVMKNMYPALEKRKLLLPFYHVRRWFRIIFSGGAKRAKAQLSMKNISEKEYGDMEQLLSTLGFVNKK